MELINANEPQYHVRSIYIDVELTCWEGAPPLGMKQEIIEIGITELNLITCRLSRKHLTSSDQRDGKSARSVPTLPAFTTDDIRQARSFPKALESLTEQFAPSRALCCTWGDDASLIAATCQARGLNTLLRNLLDLSQLFQGLIQLKQRASLQNAVEMLGMGSDGVPQRALVDAHNTVRIHAAIIRRMRRKPDPTIRFEQTLRSEQLPMKNRPLTPERSVFNINSLFCWCREGGSNPHEVALGGF